MHLIVLTVPPDQVPLEIMLFVRPINGCGVCYIFPVNTI